jgi:hypothetical protein
LAQDLYSFRVCLFLADPTIDRVEPAELLTSGERLTLFGSSLGSGQVSVRTADFLECRVVNLQIDRVLMEVGPGTGSDKCLTLRYRAGLSKAKFSYAGM